MEIKQDKEAKLWTKSVYLDGAMIEIAVSFSEAVVRRCSVKKVFLKIFAIYAHERESPF